MLEGQSGRRSQGNPNSGTSTKDDESVRLRGEQTGTMGSADDDDPADPGATDDNDTDYDPNYPSKGNVNPGDVFAETAIARGRQWVDVGMPYCGGSNRGTDYICGGTCVRTGAHASAQWDPYRTDCSGFVSWSWGLPSPGRTTTNLAPFKTDITSVIQVDELLPGDALNNSNHIVLFGGWLNPERTKARILEEYTCGAVAVDRVRDASKVSATQVRLPSGTFTAIRLNSRP